MKTLKFTYDKRKSPLVFTRTAKRWSIKAAFKNGKTIDYKNLTEASAWGIVRKTVEPAGKLPSAKLLGVEWAAIRAHRGASPLIVPMLRGGNWLYIERKSNTHYELRVVEPLGTKRTKPRLVTKKQASTIIEQASKRTLSEQEEPTLTTLTHA